MVEEIASLFAPPVGKTQPPGGQAKTSNPTLMDLMTSREVVALLAQKLRDDPKEFKAVLSLGEQIAQDPDLARVLRALGRTAGMTFPHEGPALPSRENTPPRITKSPTSVATPSGPQPVAREPPQFYKPVPAGNGASALGNDLASLPASIHGQPFQLFVFDLNHLHTRARQAHPASRESMVKRIERMILAKVPSDTKYFAFYFASLHLAHLQQDQSDDARHGWYIENSIKGRNEFGKPRYADVDVPLAHVVTQVLERYPGQVARVSLGCGDVDHRIICEAIRAAGIPLDILVVDEEDLSRELRRLANRIVFLYP